jgi:hypothetical protein
MTTLKIQIKAVYGTLKAYPLCEQSKLFAKIAGTSTLTMDTIKHIQALGFHIVAINSQNTLEQIL